MKDADATISRALGYRIHATDLQAWGGQKSITAVCGKRCSVNRALRVGGWDLEAYTCVGCRAILVERQREAERAQRLANPPQY